MSVVLETRTHGSAPPDRDPPAGGSRVAASLARVEGVRMARHPATLIGLLVSGALTVSFLATMAPVLQRDVVMVAITALPVAAGVSFAAHLAASRLRRDEALPLATVAPASPAARTVGLLLALLWPATLAGAWTGVVMLALAGTGGIGAPAVGDVFAPSGTVLLFGAFGAALGRWVPSATAGALAVPVVGLVVFTVFASIESTTAERLLPWADWGGLRPAGMIEAWPRAPWLHLLYVVLIAGVMAGLSVLRDLRRLPVVATTLAAGAGAVFLAMQLLAVWEDPGAIDALVRDIRDPGHRLACEDVGRVEVCLPPGYERWRSRLGEPAVAALAQVPPSAQPDRIVLEANTNDHIDLIQSLPPEVAAGLPSDVRDMVLRVGPGPRDHGGGEILSPDPGVIPVLLAQHRSNFTAGEAQQLDIALGVLAEATGFRDTVAHRRDELLRDLAGHRRPSADDDMIVERGPGLGEGCPPRLEAREVLTFALAAMSSPTARTALATEVDLRPYGWIEPGAALFDDWFWITDGGVTSPRGLGGAIIYGEQGIWSRGAATLGLALADTTGVTELHAAWDHWTDPSTTADELVKTFGLAPLPSPAELATEAGHDELDFAPGCP